METMSENLPEETRSSEGQVNGVHLWQALSFRVSVGLCILFNNLFLILLLGKLGSADTFAPLDIMGQALGALIAAIFCLIGLKGSWKRHDSSRLFPIKEASVGLWVPVSLALACFLHFVGQSIYLYYNLYHYQTPFPSLADVAFLAMYPFLFLGAFFLLQHSPTPTTRWCILLDSLIIMAAIFTVSWYFVLGSIILNAHESLLAQIVSIAYPFLDLVLIFSILQLILRAHEPVFLPVVRLFASGVMVAVIADSIFYYQGLPSTSFYQAGWQDVGWPLALMLNGLAAQGWNIIRSQQKKMGPPTSQPDPFPHAIALFLNIRDSRWHALLPYVLVPAVGLFTIYVWSQGANSVLAPGVYLGAVILVMLIFLREGGVLLRLTSHTNRLYSLYAQGDIQEKSRLRQEQLRLMTDFLTLASHELRTPLTTIKGNLQLAQHRLKRLQSMEEPQRLVHTQNSLASALQSVLLQERMMNAMVDYARIQAGTFSLSLVPCDLRTIVVAVVSQQQQMLPEHRIYMQIPAPEQSVPVVADANRITQVMTTFLTNAHNYSPVDRPILVQLALEERQARVSVHDAGPGIPPEEQVHLWDCFYRTKGLSIQHDLDLSMGLGLYLCKAFIECHHGYIGVRSTPGGGATFWFTLPLAQPTVSGSLSKSQ